MPTQVKAQDTTPARWFFIRSSHPEKRHLFYRVSARVGEDGRTRYTCECPHFAHRGPLCCKHIAQVKLGCGIEAQPKRRESRTTRGTGLPDYGCPNHTDCGYETAEHLGRGPYGDGHLAYLRTLAPRRSQAEMLADFGGREVRS